MCSLALAHLHIALTHMLTHTRTHTHAHSHSHSHVLTLTFLLLVLSFLIGSIPFRLKGMRLRLVWSRLSMYTVPSGKHGGGEPRKCSLLMEDKEPIEWAVN